MALDIHTLSLVYIYLVCIYIYIYIYITKYGSIYFVYRDDHGLGSMAIHLAIAVSGSIMRSSEI